MGKAPAFQFYAADFLIGTADMSVSEVGLYVRLLAMSWDKGPLPCEPQKLARISGVTIHEFEALWIAVAPKWKQTRHGYINERLEAQRAEREAFASRQSDRGRLSGEARRKRTPVEPRLNAGSTSVEPRPVEPRLNSSVFDLQTSDHDPNKERSDRVRDARADVEPAWRPSGARRADPAMRHIGYHDQHCAQWAQDACRAGICVPKYLWPQWEKRQPTEALIGFVGLWATRAKGDTAERFWPRAFEQHFGVGLAAERGDKFTRTMAAGAEAIAAVEAARKMLARGK